MRLHVVQPGGEIDLTPFAIRLIRMSHSIPEAQALAIDTPYGMHAAHRRLEARSDAAARPADRTRRRWRRWRKKPVLAMICDSTNAMVEGHSGSEKDVSQVLTALIRGLRGRVAVTCFASNVARMESIARAGAAAGRSVALVGRSLRNIDAAARECGYLKILPPFLREDDVDDVPDDNVLMLITGSQGEPRSALARVALDTHPRVALGEGDTVIFSSRVIPGNERAIGTVQDNLVRRGVNVMTDADHAVHVSGHPARDELRRLYRLVKPRYAVPVHGEWRHLTAHAALAQEAGATPILLEDGDILNLAPGSRGDRRQRAGRPAGAGRQPADPDAGRGDDGAPAHAVQRRGAWRAWRSIAPAGCSASRRCQRARLARRRRSRSRRASADEFGEAIADLPAAAAPRRRWR